MKKNKNIIYIIIVFLIVLGSLSLLFYTNLKEPKTQEIEAIVKMISNNYIIVIDENGNEYSLETNGEYNTGDRIAFIITDINKDSNPIRGTIIKINIISKNINFSIIDNDNNKQNNQKNEQEISKNEEKNILNTTESDIIDYFDSLNNKLTNYNNQDKNITASLKHGFITAVDFIFYDGKIKGKTFNELSNSAKIKILQLSLSIDEKMDKYFPGYKEEISTTSKNIYTNVKTETIKLYLDITTKICENDPDLCITAKEGLSNLKKNFSLTWDFVKEISKDGIDKLRKWYEIWKNT